MRTVELLRWRFLGHLAGAIIQAPPNSFLAVFQSLMLNPSVLPGMQSPAPVFLPGMDEDIRNRVMKALLERGENIWKFKTHWWKCTCGFKFFIGECGRPMEETSCPSCGRKVGGKEHNATSDTKE